jgi:DNA polymerase
MRVTKMQSHEFDVRRRLVLQRLESLERAGVLQLPKATRAVAESLPRMGAEAVPVTAPDVALRPAGKSVPAVAVAGKRSAWQPSEAGSLFEACEPQTVVVSKAPTLEILQQEVAGCTRCDELARTRTQTVFGVGNPDARLCFVGEAPGADEDRLGEPFVGRAGQLLTKIIEACRMNREDVYILNMIKCRPPGNRTPLPDEVANCRGYLERQFALIRPEFICCLGAVAAQNLLGTTVSISKLRGKVHVLRGAKVVCTYHPAYLLRNPAAKKDTWEDMKLLMREMGVEL